ncbi:biotin--[acetyl-CoA-carboxylase] ligase [Helicobacter sp. 16-1353]|uniref:biotin--[acetyl-CoA-carboxylase] ligase n=1 Tax=Helicobacter sp. 16-1353 TaxID=2004996 RepID=UPI000DCE06E5|nr:biotin--[acetyl-CoA-carboxylase] ligase [Helicobacter sp. 16-1353]RAX54071.1 biotin--[acetyl-CoA-carboxylase] ligase [Helicobacter sp. 16-1353]
MKIVTFKTLPSTQQYLITLIKDNKIKQPTCIVANKQDSGIGSRGNKWVEVEKGLYFSFCMPLISLPNDLKLESMSIFFGFIFKQNLANIGSKVWLKYPNDLYVEQNKIGGIICNIVNGFVVCGIGLNIESKNFATIDNGLIVDYDDFLETYFSSIDNYSWNKVFTKYSQEFHQNERFSFHYKNKILSFKNAKLLPDGAIKINNDIIYSIR